MTRPSRRSTSHEEKGALRLTGRKARGWFIGESTDFRVRGRWLYLAFLAMAVTLGGRLVDVQVRQGPQLAALASAQQQGYVPLHAQRGHILDREGRALVSNMPVYDVFADPSLITDADRHDVATQLAPILSMGPSRVEQLLETQSRFVYLAKGVSEDVKTQLDKHTLPGVGTNAEAQRVYNPSPVSGSSFAAHLLGYVDGDGHGQYGVEGYYNSVLSGTDGRESTVRDVNGNSIVLSHDKRVDPKNGSDLRLGLDSQVQYWAEQALADGMSYAQADSGQVLMMDTKTGAIRAWAEAPAYDANHRTASDVAQFRDLSIAGLYEPGSVQKVITFAGGLSNHAITPDYTFDEGPVTIDGYTIGDWDHQAHGTVTMQQVLEQSLNDGAIKVMQLMGEDAFYSNLLDFGIGSPTGIDLAGEVNQPLLPQSQWHATDFATSAFGQSISVTPVEMLAAVNAVANGGVWVQPHAVEATVDPATGKSTPFVPTTRRVMPADTANQLAHMMTGVVDNHGGSGFLARIPAFKDQVAGKTGTADEPTNGSYQGDLTDSFAGFMPVDHPQFTMLVVLRSPHETSIDREGAYLCAPVWKNIAQITIDQWRILP